MFELAVNFLTFCKILKAVLKTVFEWHFPKITIASVFEFDVFLL